VDQPGLVMNQIPQGNFLDLNEGINDDHEMEDNSQGTISFVLGSSVQSDLVSVETSSQSDQELIQPEIVLALQAAPTIFLNLEISLNEPMSKNEG
jgi:hypothetical protein